MSRQRIYIVATDADEPLVEQLAAPLTDAGYEVVHNGTVLIGESVVAVATKALAERSPVILCGTVRAVGTPWAHKIVNAARGREPSSVFVVQMEKEAYVDQLALDTRIARFCDDPGKAITDLLAALARDFPVEIATLAPENTAPEPDGQHFLDRPTGITTFDVQTLADFRASLREEVAARYSDVVNPWDFLSRSGLWVSGSLTRAGVLLFSEADKKLLVPASVVKCTRYLGVDRSASRTVIDHEGTIPEQIRSARQFVAEHVRLGEFPSPDSAESRDVHDLPMIAVREIIANALVHRDYTIAEACVHVRLYDDRLEVVSPGDWLGGLLTDGRPQALAELEGQSIKRNFRLSQVLAWAKLVEGEGSGIPTAVENCRQYRFDTPTVVQNQGLVTVTLRRRRPAQHSGPVGTAVKSRYIEQVRRIAPENLMDREAELEQIATFCTSADTGGQYRWWRAGPWSGKSALMSWFALHPPAGVRVVPFFITARLSSQNNRSAFVENVLEQLFVIVGQRTPPLLAESTREAYLFSLVNEAAEICARNGENLVLLADGLDEDRSISGRPDTSSIAALLPTTLPRNMRVIVTSRPHPPLPIDVPDTHPLRDPAIVCALEPSRWARTQRSDMERELKALLFGAPAEQDLLGLLAASGGGLSADDLAELTDLSPWEVRNCLHTAAGRTFSRRDSRYRPGVAPDVYVLGHEELQVTAREMLGPTHLDRYRSRLHGWANRYRARRWPAATPEYLLREYFYMLTASGDLRRMIECAKDTLRQDRILTVSGGDEVVLTELDTALEVSLSQKDLDLAGILCLAIHRDHIRTRNAHIPIGLPALWSRLGRTTRGLALARSLPTPSRQGRALIAIAHALVAAGDVTRAGAVLDQAEAIARPTNPQRRRVWMAMVRARAAAGELERAEASARSIGESNRQFKPLLVVALARSAAGDLDHAGALIDDAEALARSFTSPRKQCRALMAIAETWAAAGRFDRPATVLDDIEDLARSFDESNLRLLAMMVVIRGRIAAGELARAEDLATSISGAGHQCEALTALAHAFATAGDLDRARSALERAERRTPAIKNVVPQLSALLATAHGWTAAGDRHRTIAVIDRCEAMARSFADPGQQDKGLMLVAKAWTTVGELDRAQYVSRSISQAGQRCEALTAVAAALAARGDLDRATSLLDETEVRAEHIGIADLRRRLLMAMAEVWATIGDRERAASVLEKVEALARSVSTPEQPTTLLFAVAQALATAGEFAKAEKFVWSITDPRQQRAALAAVTRALAKAGQFRRAEKIARSITDPRERYSALLSVVRALAASGDVAAAEAIALSIDRVEDRCLALSSVVHALAEAGALTRAEALAGSITRHYPRLRALTSIARALASAGQVARAEELVNSLPRAYEKIRMSTAVAYEFAKAGYTADATAVLAKFDQYLATVGTRSVSFVLSVATTFAAAGHVDRAEAFASSLVRRDEQIRALTSVAYELAAQGESHRANLILGRAEGLVHGVDDTYEQVRALISIARSYSANGGLERASTALQRAENIANTLPNTHQRIRALTSITRALVAIGEFSRARVIARSMDEVDHRGKAWIWMAMCSDKANSEYAIAQVLVLDCWEFALEALATVEPEALKIAITTIDAVTHRGR